MVLLVNRDLNLINAPGNLYSDTAAVTLDPARGGAVRMELSHQSPPEEPPAETEYVKFVKIRSELLSKFHGRPMYLRAGVILPREFDREAERRYPLRVHIGGYGTRYTEVREMMDQPSSFRKAWLADDAPRMMLLHLDGAGPYGDPYQVNSANNGPYGDAVTQELIPYVEKKFRGIGQPYARVLDGHSTGGWVSLALQVFYPDFFNGGWSHAPDPVDFRAYELINIYEDDECLREQARLRAAGVARRRRRRALHGAARVPARDGAGPRRPLGAVGQGLVRLERGVRAARRRRPAAAAVGRHDRQDRPGRARPLEEVRSAAAAWRRTGRRSARSCAASCTSGSARPTIISSTTPSTCWTIS